MIYFQIYGKIARIGQGASVYSLYSDSPIAQILPYSICVSLFLCIHRYIHICTYEWTIWKWIDNSIIIPLYHYFNIYLLKTIIFSYINSAVIKSRYFNTSIVLLSNEQSMFNFSSCFQMSFTAVFPQFRIYPGSHITANCHASLVPFNLQYCISHSFLDFDIFEDYRPSIL